MLTPAAHSPLLLPQDASRLLSHLVTPGHPHTPLEVTVTSVRLMLGAQFLGPVLRTQCSGLGAIPSTAPRREEPTSQTGRPRLGAGTGRRPSWLTRSRSGAPADRTPARGGRATQQEVLPRVSDMRTRGPPDEGAGFPMVNRAHLRPHV